MDEQLKKDIKNDFLSKSTEELQKIWVNRDEDEWSEEAFEAIREILQERGELLPSNKEEFYQKILKTKSVEDLLTIWINHDQKQWSKEAFPIIKSLLMERGLKSQSLDHIKGKSNPVLKKIWREYDKESFSNDIFLVIKKILIERNEVLPAQKVKKSIEINLSTGEIVKYDEFEKISQDIKNGKLRKDFKARLLEDKGVDYREEVGKQTKWSDLEKVSKIDFKLHALYKPVWAHTIKYIPLGILFAIFLKTMDTTILFFKTNETLGIGWLLIAACMLISQWWNGAYYIAIFSMIFIMFVMGIGINYFLTMVGIILFGGIFGIPLGMILGTLIGHLRRKKFHLATDAIPEGIAPYIWGLVVPSIFLIVTVPFYIFWLNPKLIKLLS